jgi:hypothetical protein
VNVQVKHISTYERGAGATMVGFEVYVYAWMRRNGHPYEPTGANSKQLARLDEFRKHPRHQWSTVPFSTRWRLKPQDENAVVVAEWRAASEIQILDADPEPCSSLREFTTGRWRPGPGADRLLVHPQGNRTDVDRETSERFQDAVRPLAEKALAEAGR